MTLKAVRTIKGCDVIAVPSQEITKSVAYNIAVVAVPEIAKKELIGIHMPMIKNETSLKNAHVFHVLKDNSRTHNNLSIQPAYL